MTNSSELRDLVNESEEKKFEVKELIVNENCCNDMYEDLVLSGFGNLEKIVVKKGSLQNLNSLKICDNEKLKSIEAQGYFDGNWSYSFRYVKSLIIDSNFTMMI